MSDDKVNQAREELMQQKIQQQQAQAAVTNLAASIYARVVVPGSLQTVNENLAAACQEAAYAFASKVMGIRRIGPKDVTPVKTSCTPPPDKVQKVKKLRVVSEKKGE